VFSEGNVSTLVVYSRDGEGLGADHKVNLAAIFLDDDEIVLVR